VVPVLLLALTQFFMVVLHLTQYDIPDERHLISFMQTERLKHQPYSELSVVNEVLDAVPHQQRSRSTASPAKDDDKNTVSWNAIRDFSEGALNVDPILPRQCVSLRFRGDPQSYPVGEAIEMLRAKFAANPGPRTLRLGIMFMEEIEKFFPVRIRTSGNNYHLYHFMEFLVMAYAELHHIASALPPATEAVDSINSVIASKSNAVGESTLSHGNPAVTVPWIFSPYMAPSEICGGPQSLNCLAADLTLRASSHSVFQNRSGIVGLEPMEHYPFNFADDKEKAVTYRIDLVDHHRYYGDSPTFADQADGVLTVERFGCNMAGINKPWSKYIDTFPAEQWHADIVQGLGLKDDQTTTTGKLVVGYVDRQNTDRHLPEEHHDWLVEYLLSHEKIDFMQLHMESYSALDQVRAAAKCHVLIGMHGNGLTHSLWMRPGGYVIEYYWAYNFQYDYPTSAQLMNHTYLGIQNGRVIDRDMVARRDVELRRHPTRREAQHAPVKESMRAFEEQGKPAIRALIQTAIQELGIR